MQFDMKIMPLYQTMNRVLKFFIAVFSYSRQTPGQALGLQETEASRISRQSAHEGGKVVSPRHRLPLPPSPQEMPLVLLSVTGGVADTRIAPGYVTIDSFHILSNSLFMTYLITDSM